MIHKRRITIVSALYLIMTLILITACEPLDLPQDHTATSTATEKPTHTPKPTATKTPSPTPLPTWWVPAEALNGTEIAFLYSWSGEQAERVEFLVDTFNQTNEWGIFVNAYGFGSARQVFLQAEAGLQNEDPPQVVIAPVEELAYWYRFDDLVVLDPYLDDSTYGLQQDVVNDYVPLFWEQDVVAGHRLGIPVERDARFLMYNYSWAKEMGFNTSPQTPQQFETQTCSAMQYVMEDDSWHNNGTGGWIIDRQEYTDLSWLRGFGIKDFPQEETNYSYNQPATLDAFTYLRSLADQTCSWASRNPTPYEYFASREALMVSASVADLSNQSSTMQRMASEDDWTVIPYPGIDGDPVMFVYGPSFGIIKSTPQQELASWLFIRWMSEPFQQKQLANVMNGLPVSQTLLNEVTRTRGSQFATLVDLLEVAQLSPQISQWRVGRFVLPDAVYQIYQANVTFEQFPDIIDLLDKTVQELNNRRASLDW